MTQHVAHRRSDEIHELRAEIERLLAALSWIDTFDPETIAAAETKFGNLISGVEQKVDNKCTCRTLPGDEKLELIQHGKSCPLYNTTK